MIEFILTYLFVGTIWCMFMEEMSGELNPKWKDRFRWALFWPFPVIAFFIGFAVAFKKALEDFFDDLKNNQ